jgi:hypothetical protein
LRMGSRTRYSRSATSSSATRGLALPGAGGLKREDTLWMYFISTFFAYVYKLWGPFVLAIVGIGS